MFSLSLSLLLSLSQIMFFSAPYLAGGGVTIFMASAFLGTIRYGSTEANGVPVQWVSLIMFSCFISIGAYVSLHNSFIAAP